MLGINSPSMSVYETELDVLGALLYQLQSIRNSLCRRYPGILTVAYDNYGIA